MSKTLGKLKRVFPDATEIHQADVFVVDGKVYCTVNFIMEFFGVARRTVAGWQAKGLPCAATAQTAINAYDLVDTINWHAANIDQNKVRRSNTASAAKGVIPPPPNDLTDITTVDEKRADIETLDRLKKFEDLRKVRLSNAVTAGELIPAEDTDRAMAEQGVIHVTYYMDDLDTLPSALANRSESYIANFLEQHYERRIDNAHEFIRKVFDVPNWFYKQILNLMESSSDKE